MAKKKISYAKLLDSEKPVNPKEPVANVPLSTPEAKPKPEVNPKTASKPAGVPPPPPEKPLSKPPVKPDRTPPAPEGKLHPSVEHVLQNSPPTEAPPPPATPQEEADLSGKIYGQMICFRLGDEEFCIPITQVKEIHPSVDIITLPNLPEFIAGIIRLRDMVIPVVDLGQRFQFRNKLLPGYGTLIVSALKNNEVLGLLVDSISNVEYATQENVKPLPPMFDPVESEYMPGVIKLDTRLIVILDIDNLLKNEEVEELSGMGH
ncbi:MAG: hypothetical protein D6675_11730 [Gemmatimonadetes bacterium]|nr:MAG: hypothetical protein D6675_11730 [Gemmatimonadota bacterium]